MILLTKTSCRSRASRAAVVFSSQSIVVSRFDNFSISSSKEDILQIIIRVATFKGIYEKSFEYHCPVVCIDESLFSDVVLLIWSADLFVELFHLLYSWFKEFTIFILAQVRCS